MGKKQRIAGIGMPIPRHQQLTKLAERRNVTVTDVIAQFINRAIEDDELPDIIPGVEVGVGEHPVTRAPVVTMMIDGYQARMSVKVARQLADTIDHTKRARLAPTVSFNVPDSDPFTVKGRGTAVAVITRDHTANLPPSIATDISRQLRKAADVVADLEAKR